MRRCRSTYVSATVLALLAAPAAAGSRAPVPVSPGTPHGVTTITDRCPTFSWGAAPKASSYEIALFSVPKDAVSPNDVEPLMQTRVTGSASSWSPSADDCLERGRRYAWSLRASRTSGVSRWSRPALFQVAAGPTEEEFQDALRVVQDYLGTEIAPTREADTTSEDQPQEVAAATVSGSRQALAPIGNIGGGIFSETGGIGSAAVWGSNTRAVLERTRGYLAVDGSFDFDDHSFLDSAINDDEIGVLGVTAGGFGFGEDNFGVVGVSNGEGWGGRFFSGDGAETQVYLGSPDTALYLKGNDQIDLRMRIDNGGGNHYIFDDTSDSNALKIESAAGADLVFNTNGPSETMRLTSAGDVTQSLTNDGLVKAWAKINENGTVHSCYNCNAAGTSNPSPGLYDVDFNLGNISNRPILVSVSGHGSDLGLGTALVVQPQVGDSSSVVVATINFAGIQDNQPFTVFVF